MPSSSSLRFRSHPENEGFTGYNPVTGARYRRSPSDTLRAVQPWSAEAIRPLTLTECAALVARADAALGIAATATPQVTGWRPVRPESEAETVHRKGAIADRRSRLYSRTAA